MKKLLLFAKDKLFSCLILILFSPLFVLAQPSETEIQESIDAGIAWLVTQQDVDGSWNAYGGSLEAGTGLALYNLCERAYALGYASPFDPGFPYHQNVEDGFDWLFGSLTIHPISIQDHTLFASGTMDDPDENGNGTGVCALFGTYQETYSTSLILTAIASSGTPGRVVNVPTSQVDGWTYADVAQDMVDFLAWGQVEYNNAGVFYEGGWEYYHRDNGVYGSGWMGDQSNSGYAVLGLSVAQGFGAIIPDWVKIELNAFIGQMQDPVDGDPNDGGSWYSYQWPFPGTVNSIGVNTLKTGNILSEMALVGDVPTTPRVEDALDYLTRHWAAGSGINQPPGWNGDPAQYQAMFCLMKGLVFMGIEEFTGINWFDDFSTVIVAQQQSDPLLPDYGAWLTTSGRPCYSPESCDPVIITEWALLTLGMIAPPPPIVYVDFDIHPTSWPNPINVKSNGLIPTAILGTEEFDVLTIDPATLLLEGVEPVMWAYEDVTGPVEEGVCNDTEEGPDGYLDLTIKFNTQEVVEALGEVSDGQEMVLTITGNLIDEGQEIEGDDCIIIKKKGHKYAAIFNEYNLTQNYPNPFITSTTINFELPNDATVLLKVFDMVGNEVATIINQEFSAGIHSVDFDASNLKGGHYYYSIQTKDFMDVKNMILIK